jgi:hypothetical protein
MNCIRRSALIVTITTVFLSCISTAWSQQIEGDHSKILAEHKRIIDAHMMRDVEGMLEGAVDDYVLVNRGEVNYPTVDERRQKFSHYFKVTVFSDYKDLIPPIIHISDDGTAAWLIAQVEVSGKQESPGGYQPLHFVSAWIELYEKRDGEWIQTGNVSNFRE